MHYDIFHRRFACATVLIVATIFPAWATQIPDDEELESSGAVVGEIIIHSGNVFDPEAEGENRKAYRLVNKLHRTTRDIDLPDRR